MRKASRQNLDKKIENFILIRPHDPQQNYYLLRKAVVIGGKLEQACWSFHAQKEMPRDYIARCLMDARKRLRESITLALADRCVPMVS